MAEVVNGLYKTIEEKNTTGQKEIKEYDQIEGNYRKV